MGILGIIMRLVNWVGVVLINSRLGCDLVFQGRGLISIENGGYVKTGFARLW